MNPSSKKARRNKAGGQNAQSARNAAISVLQAVLVKGRSLATARTLIHDRLDEPRERSLAMELVNGVLRWRFRLEALLAQLLSKPVRKKDIDIQLVLLVALYELTELSTPDYAVVNEAVAQTRHLGKKWAAGMVNGVLRSFIRDRQALLSRVDDDSVARFSHPRWLIDMIRQDWPEHAEHILDANNQRPPMWLRVNTSRISVEGYIKRLDEHQIKAVHHPIAAAALKLDSAMDVGQLPGFTQGLVSVQDASAQLAAELLGAENGERVLDLCAAPGGKTCHVLETATNIEMTAVELEPLRMPRVQQNLDRLGLHAGLIIADATDPQSWWDGRLFDRILVDAPCSASGVIRRHPDIKSLRHADDLVELTQFQQNILLQALSMLKPGGTLLYVTCSVLKQENEQQVKRLLSTTAEVGEVVIDENWGVSCRYGRQLLPGELDGDGFYFARLKKQENATEDTAIA
mgnify:FL=1